MRKIISHILIVLSFVSFMIVGCERDEFLSKESIALDALELQLNTTRINIGNPTFDPPSRRPDWILEVQTEGNALTDYIFSESQAKWIPKTTPILFFDVSSVYDINFTLRPPTSTGNDVQDGSLKGLLEADTLEGSLKDYSPQKTAPYVALTHINSLIELTFDASVRNDITDITIEGNNVHPCRVGDGVYQFITYRGKQQITLHIKYKGKDYQCTLDFLSDTQANHMYVIPVSAMTMTDGKIAKFVGDVPQIARWSEESINGYYVDDSSVTFVFIEGYTKAIGVNFLGDKNQYEFKPYSISGEQAVYRCPLSNVKKQTIESLQLKELGTPPISIGRTTIEGTRDTISLKVGEKGNLLFRIDTTWQDKGLIYRLINTIAELQLISEGDIDDNFKALYTQESDIDFMSKPIEWTPIGWNASIPFSGTYEGNKHKICNMHMSKSLSLSDNDISQRSEEEMIGFFGYNTGLILDLFFVSGELRVNILSEKVNRKGEYGYSIGIVCGHNEGIIGLCCNYDYLLYLHIEPSEKTVNFSIGGISGKNEHLIECCLNNSKIEIIDNVGKGDIRVGGLTGFNFSKLGKNVSECMYSTNHGELSVRTEAGIGGRTHKIGGLAGIVENSVIYNSYNSGAITYTIGTQEYEYAVGGIAGIAEDGKYLDVNRCYSIGEMHVSYYDYDKQITSNNEGLGLLFGKLEKLAEVISNPSFRGLYYDNTTTEKEKFITVNELVGNRAKTSQKILKFSESDWPTNWLIRWPVWESLGGWNNGHPVYPKLWVEYENE